MIPSRGTEQTKKPSPVLLLPPPAHCTVQRVKRSESKPKRNRNRSRNQSDSMATLAPELFLSGPDICPWSCFCSDKIRKNQTPCWVFLRLRPLARAPPLLAAEDLAGVPRHLRGIVRLLRLQTPSLGRVIHQSAARMGKNAQPPPPKKKGRKKARETQKKKKKNKKTQKGDRFWHPNNKNRKKKNEEQHRGRGRFFVCFSPHP